MKQRVNKLLIALACIALTGCTNFMSKSDASNDDDSDSVFRNKALDYTKSKSVARLQVPNNLDKRSIQKDLLVIPDETNLKGDAGIEEALRPSFTFAELDSEHVQIKGAHLDKYLLINARASVVRDKLQQYLKARGQTIDSQSNTEKLIESSWSPLSEDVQNGNAVTDFLRSVTGGDTDLAYSKTRFHINQQAIDLGANTTSIDVSYIEGSYQQVEEGVEPNWQESNRFTTQQRAVLFDVVRFLNQAVVTANLNEDEIKPVVLYGQTHAGQPVLRIEMPQQQALNMLLQAMQPMDVGSFDAKKGQIYFTHTSYQKASAPKAPSSGFFAWFKDLHSSHGDKDPITLSKSDSIPIEEEAVVYSNNGIEPSVSNDLADKKGHKVWLGGKVIFVFEDEDQGEVDSEGNYVFTDNYQLHLTNSLNGVYVQIYNALGQQPAHVYAEEILAQIIEGLSS